MLVTHRLVERVLQGLGAGLHRHHRRAQQLHAVDVLRLALDVLAAHVDHALQPEAGADGGGGDAVLAGAGLGDDARLAHALGQQGLADDVVDLVRAGVVQVFALEVDLRAAGDLGPALGVVDRRRPADKVLELVAELVEEFWIFAVALVSFVELGKRVGQGFCDKRAAVRAEMAFGVGQVVIFSVEQGLRWSVHDGFRFQ
jgi:hypothetical protein